MTHRVETTSLDVSYPQQLVGLGVRALYLATAVYRGELDVGALQ